MGRCIVYTEIKLLLLICPFISSFFFLSNFQTLKFFVTLFSGTVRPRKLKFGTHVDSGQMHRVYWNKAAGAYPGIMLLLLFIPFYFLIFLSLQFSSIKKCFVTLFSGTVRPRILKLGTQVDSGYIVYTGIMLLLLFIPLCFHFSFSPIFKH